MGLECVTVAVTACGAVLLPVALLEHRTAPKEARTTTARDYELL